MEDWFVNINGIYYYSVNRTMVLELLCMENKENDRIVLSGLGSVSIKQGCYAKFDSVILVGSNNIKINSSFEISKVSHYHQILNFTYAKSFNFDNIIIKKFKESSDLDPINEFSHKLTDKYFDNVDLLTCIVSTALVIFIIIQIKKCLNVDKVNILIRI